MSKSECDSARGGCVKSSKKGKGGERKKKKESKTSHSFGRSLEGSQRNGDSHSSLYMSHLKCTSCGSQSPQHSDVCPNTPSLHLNEEMAELHSEYSDSSCGESFFFFFVYPIFTEEQFSQNITFIQFCYYLGQHLTL